MTTHTDTQTNGAMAALKAATQEAHDATEQHPFMAGLMQEPADATAYAAVLRGFLGFVRPLERALHAAVDWEAAGWPRGAHAKTAWLEADLEALGHAPNAVPDCADLPAVRSFPAALGALYVLEGSTLGGQYIAKHLCKALPVQARTATVYFTGYGSQTGSNWKQFRAFVDEACTEPTAIAEACVAAEAVFEGLSRWMTVCQSRDRAAPAAHET